MFPKNQLYVSNLINVKNSPHARILRLNVFKLSRNTTEKT